MSREMVEKIAGAFPGATRARPEEGELDGWKLEGKLFALIGHRGGGVSVKCPDVETARMLIDVGAAVKAPYFHRSWVRLPFDGLEEDELRHRLAVSYDTIRAGLPKKRREALPPRRD